MTKGKNISFYLEGEIKDMLDELVEYTQEHVGEYMQENHGREIDDVDVIIYAISQLHYKKIGKERVERELEELKYRTE